MVLIKIAAILVFVFFGLSFIHPGNYHPFAPNGFSGILAGGSIVAAILFRRGPLVSQGPPAAQPAGAVVSELGTGPSIPA